MRGIEEELDPRLDCEAWRHLQIERGSIPFCNVLLNAVGVCATKVSTARLRSAVCNWTTPLMRESDFYRPLNPKSLSIRRARRPRLLGTNGKPSSNQQQIRSSRVGAFLRRR